MKLSIFSFCLLIMLCVMQLNSQAADLGVYRPFKAGTQDYLRLQDFSIFRSGEYTYVASMMKDYCGNGIVVARSEDLINWETLGNAVSVRTAEDSAMVWAPHVIKDNGVYYMFYTGVTVPAAGAWCQRILVATTTDPSNPQNWQRNYDVQFIVNGQTQSWFRPSHAGAVWSSTTWADCRDAMVMKYNGTWYMFYSGTDSNGGITGVATASNIMGPWIDKGAVMKVAAGTIPESCFVIEAPDGSFVMTFNHAGGGGTKIARGPSLVPVNGLPSFTDMRLPSDTTGAVLTGWAHEFLPAADGALLCANLTGYYVNFKDAYFQGETYGWTVGESDTPNTCLNIKNTLPDTYVCLRNKVVSGVYPDCIYIQEPGGQAGIKVTPTLDVSVGDMVTVAGKAGLISQETAIKDAVLMGCVSGEKPKPVLMSNRSMGGSAVGNQPAAIDYYDGSSESKKLAAGLSPVGLLVKITGKVTAVDSLFAYVDDGSGLYDGSGHKGVKVSIQNTPVPAVGAQAVISGCCSISEIEGNAVRYIRPRGREDVSFSSITDYLPNSGFESGDFSGWTYSGNGGAIQAAPWRLGITPYSGNFFFGAYANASICSGYLYRQVDVPEGIYIASVYSRVYHNISYVDAAQNRIGIDPEGGTDPSSASVIWSDWDTQSKASFSEWRLISTPAVALSGTATVFLEYQEKYTILGHANCFDDVSLAVQ